MAVAAKPVSLKHFFQPQSVAVVGASTVPGKVGHDVFRNLVTSGFQGAAYPINPKAAELLGHPCYPSLAAVPGPVDLAVIVVPAAAVPQVIEECGQKGVDSAVIISAGFKETGPEGARLEKDVLARARRCQIRLIGPNCLGIIVPSWGLNASFAAAMPQAGGVAMLSQSGALATAILDWALAEGLGFSKFLSFGNAADLDLVDLMLALRDDPETKVILVYTEGIARGPLFIEVASQVTRIKPVVVVKSGGTAAGSRAVSSHTGSLAGSDQAYSAAFRQCGVLRAASVEQLSDYSLYFACQPLPTGSRLAVITNAGGPGIMATDAAERARVTLASLEKSTIENLRQGLPAAAALYNPVDVLGDADPSRYRLALDLALNDPNVDGGLVVLTPQAMTDIPGSAEQIWQAAAAQGQPKPVVACLMGGASVQEGGRILTEHQIPTYPFPERAVDAFAAAIRHREWTRQPAPEYRQFEVDRERAAKLFRDARGDGRLALAEAEAREVIQAYGFPVPEAGLASSSEQAVELANRIGYPVVIKIASPEILHKSDIGGVRVGMETPEQVVDSFDLLSMRARRYFPDAEIWGVLVQQMVIGGREVVLGMSRDPQFGPLIMFGLGGIYVEVLRDVSFRLAPLGVADARSLIQDIRSYSLLSGVRGERPADIEALIECTLRLSQLCQDFPELLEVDLNPVRLQPAGQGLSVIDARLVIG